MNISLFFRSFLSSFPDNHTFNYINYVSQKLKNVQIPNVTLNTLARVIIIAILINKSMPSEYFS